jgi:DNA-binding response OmpR family regulator
MSFCPEDLMEQKKILIADDEQSVRQLLKRLLRDKYVILEAEDGAQAVNLAGTEHPDLILMDIMMPKTDGITACYELKSNEDTKCIPIVMLTGLDYDLNRKLGQEIGAEAYITKPFKLKEILEVVSHISEGQA